MEFKWFDILIIILASLALFYLGLMIFLFCISLYF